MENEADISRKSQGNEGAIERKGRGHDEEMKGKSRGKPVVRRQFRSHKGEAHGNRGNSAEARRCNANGNARETEERCKGPARETNQK